MSRKPQRVAIYLRVSKDDGSQETDNQRWEGHELVAEYVDRESGTRGRRERKDFDRMFADAARRRFDVLLFWALDRFSREGIRKTIAYLERLDECGVSFKSHTEPFLDTDNEGRRRTERQEAASVRVPASEEDGPGRGPAATEGTIVLRCTRDAKVFRLSRLPVRAFCNSQTS
jgi:hypothetical protein